MRTFHHTSVNSSAQTKTTMSPIALVTVAVWRSCRLRSDRLDQFIDAFVDGAFEFAPQFDVLPSGRLLNSSMSDLMSARKSGPGGPHQRSEQRSTGDRGRAQRHVRDSRHNTLTPVSTSRQIGNTVAVAPFVRPSATLRPSRRGSSTPQERVSSACPRPPRWWRPGASRSGRDRCGRVPPLGSLVAVEVCRRTGGLR